MGLGAGETLYRLLSPLLIENVRLLAVVCLRPPAKGHELAGHLLVPASTSVSCYAYSKYCWPSVANPFLEGSIEKSWLFSSYQPYPLIHRCEFWFSGRSATRGPLYARVVLSLGRSYICALFSVALFATR
jgi:hypothetical protein